MGAGQTTSHRPPPAILPLIVENLPLAGLAPYPHAVTWDLAWREGTNGKPGRWTKVPKNPRTGLNAKSNDPATWASVYDVIGRFDRFGFVVFGDDPFASLDLDNAIGADGKIKPWAQAIVDRFPNAYWEISTTGTGLKGLVRGRVPRNRIIKVGDGQVEIFFWQVHHPDGQSP
jgi:primase-polymerase (primpol)-like protein